MNHCRNTYRPNSFVFTVVLLLAGLVAAKAQVSVYWGLTNNATGGNWSAGTSWVGGAAPTSLNNAVILSTNGGFFITNDVTTSVQDLTYSLAVISGTTGPDGAVITTVINPGTTLSVLGPDGFLIQHATGWKGNTTHTFSGQSLVVSNTAASFVLNSGVGYGNSSSKSGTMNFSALTNITAVVNLFGSADDRLPQGPALGDQSVKVTLARTNIITALYSANYNAIDFTNSIEIARNENIANNSFSQNSFFELGISNAFYADSFGLGRGQCVGNSGNGLTMGALTGTANGANSAGFNVSFQTINSAAPTSGAIFRNNDGASRMTLLAIGVDSGMSLTNARNSAVMNLQGGKIDMLVNQIWLGCNRTNATGNQDSGGFGFDNGTVNANTIYAGYMQYTNPAFCQGFILVGTNGVLRVNNLLELGYTPPDPSGSYITAENTTVGQLQINNGGVAHINQITVGAVSTNNAITIQSGGLLDVSNAVASASGRLTTLTANGGSLAVSINGSNPLIFVTNLNATAASQINVASISGISSYPAVVPVISYVNATGPTFWAGGTGPVGSGITGILASNDVANSTIDLIISTNIPKHLLWKGYVNNSWDTSTPNWLDMNTSLHASFSTLDYVTFDDTASSGTVNVATNITVAQSGGTGITVANNSLSYTFTSSTLTKPNGILGSGSLVKTGSGSLTIDLYEESPATVSQGSLLLTGNGTIGNVNSASNTLVNISSGGTISGVLNCSGVALNSGTIANTMTVNSGGIATNNASGTMSAAISVRPGALLYNSGLLAHIGTGTQVSSNAFLINNGTIGNTVGLGDVLNVAGTFEDLGGSTSMQLMTVSIAAGGTFIPGGSGIGTTTITSDGSGNFPGAATFATGSTNIFKVNLSGTPTYTVLNAGAFSFGPSQNQQAQNGCTLLISNVAGSFQAGQTFQLFQNSVSPGSHNLSTGQSTNSYPIILPASPGPGLTWDLSHLWVPNNSGQNGIIGVITIASSMPTFTNGLTYVGNSVKGTLSWDASYLGYRLETEVNPLSVGLSNDWIGVAGSTTNTSVTISNNITPNTVTFYRLTFP